MAVKPVVGVFDLGARTFEVSTDVITIAKESYAILCRSTATNGLQRKLELSERVCMLAAVCACAPDVVSYARSFLCIHSNTPAVHLSRRTTREKTRAAI